MIVGDGEGRVGFGVGKANEVPDAIKKASDQAKKTLYSIVSRDGTIPYEVEGRYGSTLVKMMPAKQGTGIIAGGAARVLLELGGLQDVVCKIHGSKNGFNVVRAAVDGINQLISTENYCRARDKSPDEVVQKRHPKKEDKSKI